MKQSLYAYVIKAPHIYASNDDDDSLAIWFWNQRKTKNNVIRLFVVFYANFDVMFGFGLMNLLDGDIVEDNVFKLVSIFNDVFEINVLNTVNGLHIIHYFSKLSFIYVMYLICILNYLSTLKSLP